MFRRLKSTNIKYRLRSLIKPRKRNIISVLLFTIGLFVLPIVLVNFFIKRDYQELIFQESEFEDIQNTRIGIVFGAGLDINAENPSLILKDRLDTAVNLYESGKIEKVIVSGDNRFENYNEPNVMYEYLIKAGISEFDVHRDYAGRSTYDTCFRAKEIFGVSEALLITQSFHLPRALYTCQNLGVQAQGASADRHVYTKRNYNNIREIFAMLDTFIKIHISPPEVILGDKIVI